MRNSLALAFFLVAACHRPEPTPTSPVEAGAPIVDASQDREAATNASSSVRPETCAPPGLGAAKAIPTWDVATAQCELLGRNPVAFAPDAFQSDAGEWNAPPYGGCCGKRNALELFPPVVVRSATDLSAELKCANAAGFDFRANVLVIRNVLMSEPASLGTDVYDDGKTLTWVQRVRDLRPGESSQMPNPMPVAVVLPAGATRRYADASCKVALR